MIKTLTSLFQVIEKTLTQHVHLHCLIPGEVLTADGGWRAASGNYLFPKRALSRRFQGRMVSC